MDTRRLILLCIFFFSAYMLWQNWLAYNHPAPRLATAQTTAPANIKDDEVPQFSAALSHPDALLGAPEESSPATPSAQKIETFTVETDLFWATFSTQGGDLIKMVLKHYRDSEDQSKNFVYFDPKHHYAAQSGLIGKNVPSHKTIFQLQSQNLTLQEGENTLEVVLSAPDENGVKVQKKLLFTRNSYQIQFSWEIDNQNTEALEGIQAYYQLLRDDIAPEGSMNFVSTFTGPAVFTDEDKYQKISFEDIADKSAKFTQQANNGWTALVQHYFVAAWVPQNTLMREFYMRKVGQSNIFRTGMVMPLGTLASGQNMRFSVPLYVGPQEQARLEKLHPQLPLVVDYGWLTMIAAPIFWLLEAIHSLVGNWGWAIIVLTVLIKALFFPLSAASYKSMAKMRVITPRLTQIRERYQNDRAAMNREMMKLYQTEKINPLGGCLPILVQIPVFIALYWVLLGAVEMRGAPWLGWIHDLSAPDPYFILPLVMIASMVIQMRLNPPPTDPVQAKVMMIMPFAFGIMFLFFPSGLVLYWVVNNILSIAQQWHITRHYEHLTQPAKAANDS